MKTEIQVQDIEVTINELIDIIVSEVETKSLVPFMNITTETPFTSWLKKSKTDGTINPYWKEVTKEVTKTYLPVVNYKNRVTKNMNKEGIEGEHDLKNLKGKRHVSKCILTNIDQSEGEKFYIMVEQFNEVKPSKTTYRHNGNEIDKLLFDKWINYYDNYTNQEQDRKVQVLTPLLSNIKRIKFNGQGYQIKK
jgi:hypothetical protein